MCMAWRFHFPIRNYDFKLLMVMLSPPFEKISIHDFSKLNPANKYSIVNVIIRVDPLCMNDLCFSVAYVSRSGGMSNELNNIIAMNTNGVYEGIAIGGDRYSHLMLSHYTDTRLLSVNYIYDRYI